MQEPLLNTSIVERDELLKNAPPDMHITVPGVQLPPDVVQHSGNPLMHIGFGCVVSLQFGVSPPVQKTIPLEQNAVLAPELLEEELDEELEEEELDDTELPLEELLEEELDDEELEDEVVSGHVITERGLQSFERLQHSVC